MGLSIHYSGRFNRKFSLSEMIEEVKDIVTTLQWKHFVYEDSFPPNSLGKASYNKNIYGICFTPPECETVFLSFLSNGRMSSSTNLEFFGFSKKKKDAAYLYMLSVKTQYAGIEIHKLLIHLLKYLSQKYFSYFKLTDEGKYWETGDEELLQQIFDRYTFLIDSFATSLESYPMKKGETFETYFLRLMKDIQDKIKK